MRKHPVVLTTATCVLALLAAACGPSDMPVRPKSAKAAASAKPKAPAVATGPVLTGVARSPASLLSTNGGGIISSNTAGILANNAGGLVSNNAGGILSSNTAGYLLLQQLPPVFRLLAEEMRPIAKRKAHLLDASRRRVRGVNPVETDAQGRFTFTDVPPGNNWIVEVQLDSFALSALGRVDSPNLEVNPITTIVTEHLRHQLRDQPAALRILSVADYTKLTGEVAQEVAKGDVRIDLSNTIKAAQTFEQMAAKVPALAKTSSALVSATRTEFKTAQSAGKLDVELTEEEVIPPVASVASLDLAPLANAFAAYVKTRQIGIPRDIGQGSQVALWNGLPAQWFTGGADTRGHAVVLYGPKGPKLIRNEFYDRYISAAQYWTLGAPTGDEEELPGDLMVAGTPHKGPHRQQAFENGVLAFTPTSGIVMRLNGKSFEAGEGQREGIVYPPPGIPAVVVSTHLGSSRGDEDGNPSEARFNMPWGMAADAEGTLYISDNGNGRIRRIDGEGKVTSFTDSFDAVMALPGISGLTAAGPNNLFVLADNSVYSVRNGRPPLRIAGSLVAGMADGPGDQARFGYPRGIALSQDGKTLFVSDAVNHRICKIALDTPEKTVTTYAGGGGSGLKDGKGGEARFHHPHGLFLDGSGILYVADSSNHAIRRITPDGTVSTLSGTTGQPGSQDGPASGPANQVAMFTRPMGIVMNQDGDLYVSEETGCAIRKIALGTARTYTLAGHKNRARFQDGPGDVAGFNGPAGIFLDRNGQIFVADRDNHRIRKLVFSVAFQAVTPPPDNSAAEDDE
ncbi:MAG: SMP-30/gluconolactonase/LRE family protein [Candidatus Sericytochromatia bacterium]|nr:SMP-30/gluconolactonase/LRE family protein [Candidatus Sericytochromatia bacterium]